jgi:hypothetical protein
MAEKWWEWLMEMYLSSFRCGFLIHRNTNPNHCNLPLAIIYERENHIDANVTSCLESDKVTII